MSPPQDYVRVSPLTSPPPSGLRPRLPLGTVPVCAAPLGTAPVPPPSGLRPCCPPSGLRPCLSPQDCARVSPLRSAYVSPPHDCACVAPLRTAYMSSPSELRQCRPPRDCILATPSGLCLCRPLIVSHPHDYIHVLSLLHTSSPSGPRTLYPPVVFPPITALPAAASLLCT